MFGRPCNKITEGGARKNPFCEACVRNQLEDISVSEVRIKEMIETMKAMTEKEKTAYLKSKPCDDMNAGAFDIVLAETVGKGGTIILDTSRDHVVMNQPVDSYTRKKTGIEIKPARKTAAKNAVKEVEIETTVYFDSNADLGFPNGKTQPIAYKYFVEVDKDGKILGGSWVGDERPDFAFRPKKEFSQYEKVFSGPYEFLRNYTKPIP
jgi:hypothetical protein